MIKIILDNEVLADKNEINKDEAESQRIVSLVILVLKMFFFLTWSLSNLRLIDVCFIAW